MNLRAAVKRRYALTIDFKEYESKIQKLLDTHVSTGNVEKVTNLVNIFDKDAFQKEVEKVEGTASRADMIAHRTKKTIVERMDEDPAFYRKFSEMLEEAIRAFREHRLADRDYLFKVTEIAEGVCNRKDDGIPASLHHLDVAKAFYGILNEAIGLKPGDIRTEEALAELAIRIDEIVRAEAIVNWVTNMDVRNRMQIAIEDDLHDFTSNNGLQLSYDQIDSILEKSLEIARRRHAH